MIALMLVCSVSCTSVSQFASTIYVPKNFAIREFLQVSSDDEVKVARLDDADGEYLLVYSHDYQKGVVLDVDKEEADASRNLLNVAYGSHMANGGWNLFYADKGGNLYETQGGIWTLQHYGELLSAGIKKRHKAVLLGDLMRFEK